MALISSYSLQPFHNELQEDELLHLVRRCLFGVGHKELHAFKGKKLQSCLDILLHPSATPAPVTKGDFAEVEDPLVPLGATWVNAPYENDDVDFSRKTMLRMWWTGLIINRDFSLTEKLTLFWHNHFAVEADIVKDSRYAYHYAALLRKHALGNFKKLIREGTTNSAMLVYLGGNTNFKSAPNENYARELMELFTLGKGYGVQYTEADVKAGARVLTGWRDDKEKIVSVFDPAQHETSDKRFSSFFNNSVIKGRQGSEGVKETDELIEMIFTRKEAARFVCRNLYRWFVFAHVDEKIENEIIHPLADLYINNQYEIIPVLRSLLGSQHFFDAAFRGCLVKSPVDFLIGAAQQIGLFVVAREKNSTLASSSESWFSLYFYCEGLSMRIGDPPSVAGWPAYYQPPKYHQWWVNSASLSMRKALLDEMCSQEGLVKDGCHLRFDFLSFAAQFADHINLDAFVRQSTALLCPLPLNKATLDQLKELLVSGMETDYYWTKEWEKLKANPENNETKEVLNSRLRMFFAKLFSLPEYQMM